MKILIKCFTYLFFIAISNAKIFATTLKEALQSAYKNSETIYIKMAQKDISSIDRDKAIANFLPTVDVNYAWMRVNNSNFKVQENMVPLVQQIQQAVRNQGDALNNYSTSSKKVGSTTLGITANVSLSYYKTVPNLIAMQKNVTANSYEYNEFLENFGLLFIQKYMDIIYYSKSKEVFQQMTENYSKKLQRVSIMNKYGTAKRDKVVLAEAQLYENKANEITTQSALDKAKMDYKIMTGREPHDLQIPNLTNIELPAKNKNDYVALVLASNSTLKKVEKQLEVQKLLITASSMNVLPDIFATYSYNRSNIPHWYSYNYDYFGIGLSWSFNGRDKPITQVRKSYKNYRIADLNKTLTAKQIEQDAVYSWEQYFAMVELVRATEKALKASTDSLKEVKVSVSTGTATFIDEMDVETQYLNANLNYLNAQKSLILAYYKLISLTGVGYLQ